MIAITFIVFLLLFTVVGIYSATKKQNTTTDYLLASRKVNPFSGARRRQHRFRYPCRAERRMTALSAMATGQSGLLFIGNVGFAYKVGVSAIWIPLAWAVGDYLAWWFVFKRLRVARPGKFSDSDVALAERQKEVSEETASDTVSSFLGKNQTRGRWIIVISALITIAFLGSYAAAQLVAGSKALNAVFGWNYQLGIIVGALIVVIYCFSGGIRASLWTDSVQAILMIGSLSLLCGAGIVACGGFGELWLKLNEIDPTLTEWIPSNKQWGFLPYCLGWIVAGFGAVGQPHILVRGMAIDSADNMAKARNIKFLALGGGNIAFAILAGPSDFARAQITSAAAFGVGLSARVLLPDLMINGDPELALPYLSLELLPVVLVGLMLAGLFAATISTADSQILSCSAALTQDLVPRAANSYRMAKSRSARQV